MHSASPQSQGCRVVDPVEHSAVRRRFHLAVLVLSICLASCATARFEPIDPAIPIALTEDEGLLIIHIDTDHELRQLGLSAATVEGPIAKGRHLWVTRAEAGSYSWQSVTLNYSRASGERFRLDRNSYPHPSELDFRVEPGVINYAGELIIRFVRRRGRRKWLSVRHRNHAAMALRELPETFSQILDAYPLRSSGTSDDEFLEFLSSERERVRREATDSGSGL
jgi:hypothetical protein